MNTEDILKYFKVVFENEHETHYVINTNDILIAKTEYGQQSIINEIIKEKDRPYSLGFVGKNHRLFECHIIEISLWTLKQTFS